MQQLTNSHLVVRCMPDLIVETRLWRFALVSGAVGIESYPSGM